jgi:hypothetical protein
MGFGFGKKRKLRLFGEVKPIDKAITGTSGVKGRIGKVVKPIDKKTKNIFDPL